MKTLFLKKITLLLGLTSAIVACDGLMSTKKNNSRHIDPAQSSSEFALCPQSSDSWREWRDSEFVKLSSYSYTTNARYMGSFFQKCQSSLQKLTKANSCMKNMIRFTTQKMREGKEGHSLGFALTDSDYFASIPKKTYFELPEFITNQAMLSALDEADIDSGREKILSEVNKFNEKKSNPEDHVHAVFYRSRHIPSPDDSESLSRFLFYVPSPEYDQFIQFSVRDRENSPLGQSISLIVVQKQNPLTQEKLEHPIAYFNDLYRVRSNNQIILSTRLKENRGKLERCTRCHSSAVLPLIPDTIFFDTEKFGKPLEAINRIINQYGGAKIAEFDQEGDGPALLENILVTPELIKQCAGTKPISTDSLTKVAAAMNCYSCHNGKNRGRLTLSSMYNNQLPLGGSLISHYVKNTKTMPPGADLTDQERDILVSCLAASYSPSLLPETENRLETNQHGTLESWLLQKDCHF